MVLTMKSLQEYIPKRKDVVSVSVPDTGDIEKITCTGFHQVLFVETVLQLTVQGERK